MNEDFLQEYLHISLLEPEDNAREHVGEWQLSTDYVTFYLSMI